jgi:hypothetical protein
MMRVRVDRGLSTKSVTENNMLQPGGKYHHYKGKDYEVIGIAKHSETLEEMVIIKHCMAKVLRGYDR